MATHETVILSLPADEAAARDLADRLGEAFDDGSVPVSVFETENGRWQVALYCATPNAAATAREMVASVAGPEIAAGLTASTVSERDWVAASLAGLAPVTAGRFFVHGQHDRHRVPPSAVAIEIEAALAFGTGHHGTTRGCLLALDGILRRGRLRRILDVGTGTGILAMAAAKSTRRRVLASDIDPQAVKTARENARANGVGPLVETIRAAGLHGRRLARSGAYDLIFANILLGPLQRLAAPIARSTARGGRVVLSGLLVSHANAALSAYRLQGLRLVRRIDLEGWATLVLARPTHTAAMRKPRTLASGAFRRSTGWQR